MKREVWTEFADGSVAKYGIEEDALSHLLTLLSTQGPPCAIWVDGRPWTPSDRIEASDPDIGAD